LFNLEQIALFSVATDVQHSWYLNEQPQSVIAKSSPVMAPSAAVIEGTAGAIAAVVALSATYPLITVSSQSIPVPDRCYFNLDA
jgi:hypothetical protein